MMWCCMRDKRCWAVTLVGWGADEAEADLLGRCDMTKASRVGAANKAYGQP